MAVVALNQVDDVLIMTLPEAWTSLPKDLQQGLGWWALIEELLQQRGNGFASPVSALRDVQIDIVQTREDMEAIEVRHTCPRCRRARQDVMDVFAKEGGAAPGVIVCQFTYTEITDVGHAARNGLMD